jgi:hypothetical protein
MVICKEKTLYSSIDCGEPSSSNQIHQCQNLLISYFLARFVLYSQVRLFSLLYAVFFFPMLVSMLPSTHVTANTANMPRVITTGFLYPAVQG